MKTKDIGPAIDRVDNLPTSVPLNDVPPGIMTYPVMTTHQIISLTGKLRAAVILSTHRHLFRHL